MSRISNERIKVLTLKESLNYSRALSKESQRTHKHDTENYQNSYKTFMK